MTAPSPADQAHPPRERWVIEMWDGDTWLPVGRPHGTRAEAEADLVLKHTRASRWADGQPVRHRIVCETTTYTVHDQGGVT